MAASAQNNDGTFSNLPSPTTLPMLQSPSHFILYPINTPKLLALQSRSEAGVVFVLVQLDVSASWPVVW